jgi:hypothetical protein
MEAVETFEFEHGVTAEIVPDEEQFASNPRDNNENLSVIVSWNERGGFGEEDVSSADYYAPEFKVNCPKCDGSGEDADETPCPMCEGAGDIDATPVEWAKERYGAVAALAVRYEDYGSSGARIYVVEGTTIEDLESANGVAYVTREACEKFGVDASNVEEIEQQIRGEISEFSSYVEGHVYGIVVRDADGEVAESVWGFIGDPFEKESYIVSEAKSLGEHVAEEQGSAPAEFEIVVRVKLTQHLEQDGRARAAEAFRRGIVEDMSVPQKWRYGVIDVAEVTAETLKPKQS